MLGPNTFRFLNREGTCASAHDWNAPSREKLWLYNLHYFDDLSVPAGAERLAWHRALLERWIAENPPVAGSGWEAYPTSLRIVNWAKWANAGNPEPIGLDHSLGLQSRWLVRRVEHHLLANHLLANAKALIISGLFLEGNEADAWRTEGLAVMERELPVQVLADGGHYERSPMYHSIVAEDLLDLVNFSTAYPGLIADALVTEWSAVAGRMVSWARAMSHPDGEISFFNDAAFGIASRADELEAYAGRLGIASVTGRAELRASGYVRAESGPATLIVDAAPIGPDYQPAHAHADTLSFELSLFGQRVLVNGGTSTYERGEQRSRERSTAAHNTVEIDGADSSEVWSAFRVARRARPLGLTVMRSGAVHRIAAAHTGYRRLQNKPTHHRDWRLDETSLSVTDRITGTFRNAVARFHLHPSITVNVAQRELRLPSGERARWSIQGGTEQVDPSAWHPEFGASAPASCIRVDFAGTEMRFELEWRR